MRQGDGTDLLGPNDPRSASIGVIYVTPNDDRQSVLTAILTQDKLGFKQVVVVLPDQNKAFQRPVDFDGLKNMRHGVKAEIVFIAPSGPGPAEFARQRRFPVYSSLESFSHSIKFETIASGTAKGSTKRELFGLRGKQKVAATIEVASVSGSRVGEESTPPPGIITFSSTTPRPKNTRKFPVPPAEAVDDPTLASEISSQQNVSNTARPNRRNNTRKMAAVVGGATAVGVGATKAGSAASGGGGQPPSGNAPGRPGGVGLGGTSRQTRILLAILLGILSVLLIGGITIAAIPGGFNNITHIIPGGTIKATVTITPDSQVLTNTYVITAVTGTSNPEMREVSARVITATSPTKSRTVTSTGSIPGTKASGQLTFINNTKSKLSFDSTILKGNSRVPVSFNGPITVPAVPPASVTVNGFAVNVGSAGNIGALDIFESCCTTGITVRNGAFSGGQDPQPNSIVQQSDIDGAANALTASLTPGTKTALQGQVKSGEVVVPNTLQCNKSNPTVNHGAGDHAPNVTVEFAIACTEEIYDQQAALTMAAGLLETNPPPKAPGPPYALNTDKGNILTEVTDETLDKNTGTVSLVVSAKGVWVYHFDDSTLTSFKNHIAKMSEKDAINYLKGRPGVSDVTIVISSGTGLPDAANITLQVVYVAGPGATGSPTVPKIIPSVVPTNLSPTPTQGLGGS